FSFLGSYDAMANGWSSRAPEHRSPRRRWGWLSRQCRDAGLWEIICVDNPFHRTTPSAPIKGRLRRYLLEVASTPPLEEGTSSRLTVSSCGHHALEPATTG